MPLFPQLIRILHISLEAAAESALCHINLSSFSFIDHLAVMFGEELPPWDTDRKYHPENLQVCLVLIVIVHL